MREGGIIFLVHMNVTYERLTEVYSTPNRIRWEPVVFTFSFSNKEMKTIQESKDNPLSQACSRLESLDVKIITSYLVDKTTHVVQKKRNTAKGLQALVNAKYIVQDSYLDALVYAATPSDLENPETLCPLEVDFDAAWPDPIEHLPPPGREPKPKPPTAFMPNSARNNVFEGYTFVFGDSSQLNNLCAPINNGHGKAVLYEVKSGVTTADDVVQFMRDSGDSDVVLVRFPTSDSRGLQVIDDIAKQTGQCVIEQSEFLNAILENDASSLCRPLRQPAETEEEVQVPSTQEDQRIAKETQQNLQPAIPPESSPQTYDSLREPSPQPPSQPANPRRKQPIRRRHISRVKTFDDGFDDEPIPPVQAEDGSHNLPTPLSQADEENNVSHNLPTTQTNPVVEEPLTSQVAEPQTGRGPSEDSEPMREEAVFSDLLPGDKAMKRRRAQFVQNQREGSHAEPEQEAPKAKKPKLDVKKEARKHLDADEDARQRKRHEEESNMHTDLEDMSIEEMKSLAIVEEFPMPERKPSAVQNSRWDDRWNGRKNFKKFRRKGEPRALRGHLRTVVQLEEVPRNGPNGWVEEQTTDRSNSNRSQRASQRVPSSTPQDEEEAEEAAENDGMSDINDEDGGASGDIRSTTITAPSQRSSQTASSGLRLPQKRIHEQHDSDSEEEELRFRFRRRR